MKPGARWMKGLALLLTIGILIAIYARIDRRLLIYYFTQLHPGYFALALIIFIPQILVSSFRWQTMTRQICPMGLGQSMQQVMAAKALNALVPSKLGEMSKAYFLRMSSGKNVEQTVPAVILEKVLDMGGLCAVLMVGVLIAPQRNEPVWLGGAIAGGCLAAVVLLLLVPLRSLGERLMRRNGRLKWLGQLLLGWDNLIQEWKRRGRTLSRIVALSVLLWGLHLLQIYLFFPSLNHSVPLTPALTLIPLAILVGLLPITIGGMGTRDSALIVLFAPYANSALMAGVGLLCSMRYWVDTLLGVPFLHWYTRRMGEGAGGRGKR
ncbi:MAG: flippase-like domain-containing protein [Deltaproteobacteria bacterium]|nr:MAG: flippase-like domain-containing protein [Deltaproteobacteria bacterium]